MTYEYTNLNLKDESFEVEVEVTIEVYDLRVYELRVFRRRESEYSIPAPRGCTQDIEFRHREGAIQ